MPEEAKTWVPEGGGEEKEGFAALPAGIWDVNVYEVEGSYSVKGNEMITWVLVIENESHAGSRLWHRTVMTEQAKSFPGDGFYAVLNRLKLSDVLAGQTLDFYEMASILAEEAPGRKARVSVTQYEWEGKLRNDIDNFWDPEDPEAPECRIFPVPEGAEGATPPAGAAPVTGGSAAHPPAAPAAPIEGEASGPPY